MQNSSRGQRPNGQRPTGQRPSGQRPVESTRRQGAQNSAAQSGAARRRAYEAEMRRRKEAEKRRRQAKRQHAWKVFCGRAVLFGIIFAILAAAFAVGFWIHFNKTNEEKEPTTVRYTYGGAEGTALDDTLAYQNGVLYVDFTETASYLGMTPVGGADFMRFILVTEETGDSAGSGNEEDVIFYADSDLATVNGQRVRLDEKTVLYGDHYLVPASFIAEYMNGVSVTEEKNRVQIARTYTDSVADALSFTLKRAAVVEPLPEDTEIGAVEPVDTTQPIEQNEPDITVSFQSDLSAYEEYMNPADRDAYLILVNSTHSIDENYLPDDLTALVDTRKDGRNTQKMAKTAAMALEAMFIEMRACGYTDVSVTSAYRSYSYQSQLFNMYTDNEMAKNPSLTRAEAEAITVTYSNRPGTSEHQTGLCCDMHNLSSADQAFAKKEAYTWLKENAWKFGFIIRYPEDKQDITKVSFEPWHYRFVGRYHAKAMKDSGMCLEEYVESLQ